MYGLPRLLVRGLLASVAAFLLGGALAAAVAYLLLDAGSDAETFFLVGGAFAFGVLALRFGVSFVLTVIALAGQRLWGATGAVLLREATRPERDDTEGRDER